MVVQRDRLIQQVKTAARWELMKEWLEERTGDWNPGEEYRKYMFLFGRPSEEPGYAVPPASTGSREFYLENSEVRLETRKFVENSEVRWELGSSLGTRKFDWEFGSSLETRKFVEELGSSNLELGSSRPIPST
ncbi:hypothetical protein Rs2_02880 [Raphanus sativus]|nr:hypothetical protein Rs2_02880 [Raphanus sativus]